MIAPLVTLLYAGSIGHMIFSPHPSDHPTSHRSALVQVGVPVSIFARFPTGRASDGAPFWKLQHKIHAPSIIALIQVMDSRGKGVFKVTSEEGAHTIWQSALMRTASRPVDMVYSVMGLFDISLDPSLFAPDDLHRASIALAREIIGLGWGACWLGAAYGADSQSTLPNFPRASVAGVGCVQTENGWQEVDAIVYQPVQFYYSMRTQNSK